MAGPVSTVRTRYADALPRAAGVVKDERGDGVPACMVMEQRLDTPPEVRKWRRSANAVPGQRVLHPGQIDDAKNMNPSTPFGGNGIKSSVHVADVWQQPGCGTDLNRLKLATAEAIYHSSRREPLGRAYSRGHQLPDKVLTKDFHFGVTSDKSESAKQLLYPRPTEAQMQGLELYRRSHNSSSPGEQRQREYQWTIDVKTHKFGRPGGNMALNGASHNVAAALCMDSKDKQSHRLASKKLEDFKNTHDALGRAKNLGHYAPADKAMHIYGKEAVHRGPDQGARTCIEGEYSWEEQQPDHDLGKSITPGFRNATAEGRAFGVPSIRSDIKPYGKRSVADSQNYGDDANARFLVNPSQFSSMGIEDEQFFLPRSKEEIRDLFESIGYSFPDEVFDGLWQEVQDSKGQDGGVSITDFQVVVNALKWAEDMDIAQRGPASVQPAALTT